MSMYLARLSGPVTLSAVFSATASLLLFLLTVNPTTHAASVVAVGPPVTENSVQFEIISDTLVRIPKAGAETPVKINIRATNLDKQTLRFDTLDTIAVSLTDPSGRQLQLDGGRDGMRVGNRFTRPLKPGENLLIGLSAKLVWESETNLRLIGDDGFGGVWHFDYLAPGKYYLSVFYVAPAAQNLADDRVWEGRVVIPAIQVELK